MSANGLRFAPPRNTVAKEVDWLFLRALGPSRRLREGATPIDIAVLETFIGARELMSRIWVRTDPGLLERELDSAGMQTIERNFRHAVAIEMRDHEVCRWLAELASQQQMSLIFLKGMALQLAGYVEPGVRRAADIDLLVSEESAPELHRMLVEEGGEVRDLPASDQHLPVLELPLGSLVEVHHRLRGISLAGSRFATVEICIDRGVSEQLGGWPPMAHVLTRELMTGHLLVHALVQHGFWPEAYPQIQALADLQDLGFGDDSSGSSFDDVCRLVEPALTHEEVSAIRDLVQRLAAGECISEIIEGADEIAQLARHIVAGASDPGYRQALKVEGSLHVATGQSRSHSAVKTLRKALFLTRGQIDIIYGSPKTPLGYLGRRLWRPFDLMGRTWRSAVTWSRVRRR